MIKCAILKYLYMFDVLNKIWVDVLQAYLCFMEIKREIIKRQLGKVNSRVSE